MIAMLLMMAAAQQGVHAGGVATARILPGARISLAEQKVRDATAEPQRRTTVRQEAGQPLVLQLLEFQ